MKKILLGIGTATTILAPIATVVACGDQPKKSVDKKDDKLKIKNAMDSLFIVASSKTLDALKMLAGEVTELALGISLPNLTDKTMMKLGDIKIESGVVTVAYILESLDDKKYLLEASKGKLIITPIALDKRNDIAIKTELDKLDEHSITGLDKSKISSYI